MPVPVFGGHRLLGGGYVEVGEDERVGLDRVGGGELVEWQRPLVGVQGAAPPRPRVGRHLLRESRTRRISSRVPASQSRGA
jgi:hypothetical protein